MIQEYAVRQKLFDLLCDRVSLEDFEDWLVAHSWNMHRDSIPAVQMLVSAVELALSEHSSSHMTEVELREELGNLLRQVAVTVSLDGSSLSQRAITTSASSYQAGPRPFVVALPA